VGNDAASQRVTACNSLNTCSKRGHTRRTHQAEASQVNVRFCTALGFVAPLLMVRVMEVVDHEVACSNSNGTHGVGNAVRVQQQFKSHCANITDADTIWNRRGLCDRDGSVDDRRGVSISRNRTDVRREFPRRDE
jgi:hypothetical protein